MDSKLSEIINILNSSFPIQEVYLFGSRSKKIEKSDSDYDLVVVLKYSNISRLKRQQKARSALFGIGVPIDIFIYTQEEFDTYKQQMNSIPEIAFNEGKSFKIG